MYVLTHNSSCLRVCLSAVQAKPRGRPRLLTNEQIDWLTQRVNSCTNHGSGRVRRGMWPVIHADFCSRGGLQVKLASLQGAYRRVVQKHQHQNSTSAVAAPAPSVATPTPAAASAAGFPGTPAPKPKRVGLAPDELAWLVQAVNQRKAGSRTVPRGGWIEIAQGFAERFGRIASVASLRSHYSRVRKTRP